MTGQADHFGGRITMDQPAREAAPGIFRVGAGKKVDIGTAIEDLRTAAASIGTLADITIEGDRPKLSDILARLRRWGVVVLPGIVGGVTLGKLEDEFRQFMERQEELRKLFQVDKTEDSCCIRVLTDRLDRNAFPITSSFFASPAMKTIADNYFGDSSYRFNFSIFVHRTEPTLKPLSGELHFDVTRMLKFWVYLSDGSAENGAMRASPGSHLWWKLMRRDYSDRLVPKAQIPNEIDERHHPAIPLTGPAGTMFIFDTDVAHGASPVLPGHERRIMRAHCTEDYLVARAGKRG
jgi:hypothetical protein